MEREVVVRMTRDLGRVYTTAVSTLADILSTTAHCLGRRVGTGYIQTKLTLTTPNQTQLNQNRLKLTPN